LGRRSPEKAVQPTRTVPSERRLPSPDPSHRLHSCSTGLEGSLEVRFVRLEHRRGDELPSPTDPEARCTRDPVLKSCRGPLSKGPGALTISLRDGGVRSITRAAFVGSGRWLSRSAAGISSCIRGFGSGRLVSAS
jgi:hypothetical protein